VLNATSTADFLGVEYEVVIVIGGVLSGVYGLHVLFSLFRHQNNSLELTYFAFCDAGWILATAALLLLGFITTTKGIVVSLIIALMVTYFGVNYLFEARRIKSTGDAHG